MSERELDELNFKMAYYSKGRLPIKWLEGVAYRRRSHFVDLLGDQLTSEAMEIDKASKAMRTRK